MAEHARETVDRASLGAGVYSRAVLAVYDPLVIHLANPLLWKCPSRRLLAHYDRHVSGNHLDVGVGTGWFLDRCRFPCERPRVALMDLNPNSLRAAAWRIRRYRPAAYQADVLKPLPPDLPRVDSIGMNFLLHCLPGPMANKTRAVAHLAPLLSPGGVLFGSTILVKGRQHGRLGRFVLRLYNARILPKCRVFDNLDDGADDVEAMLKAHFQEHRLEIVGHVALFAGFA